MTLITQVKKEIADEDKKRKEELNRIKIRQMLNIIGSKKKQIEKLAEEIKTLEQKLEKGEYLSLQRISWGSNGTLVYVS